MLHSEELFSALQGQAQDAVDRGDIRISKIKYDYEKRLAEQRRLRALGQCEILRLRRQVATLQGRLDELSAAGSSFVKALRSSRG